MSSKDDKPKDDKPPDGERIERDYEHYRPVLKRHFWRFGKDAEDLVQLVYMRLMRERGLSEIRDPKKFVYYLANFVLLDESPHLTEEAQTTVHVDPTAPEEFDSAQSGLPPDSSTEEVADAEWEHHIKALPLEQRQVLVLRWVHGHSIPEIVVATGYKKDAVKKYLKKAIDHLRECYGDDSLGRR